MVLVAAHMMQRQLVVPMVPARSILTLRHKKKVAIGHTVNDLSVTSIQTLVHCFFGDLNSFPTASDSIPMLLVGMWIPLSRIPEFDPLKTELSKLALTQTVADGLVHSDTLHSNSRDLYPFGLVLL